MMSLFNVYCIIQHPQSPIQQQHKNLKSDHEIQSTRQRKDSMKTGQYDLREKRIFYTTVLLNLSSRTNLTGS